MSTADLLRDCSQYAPITICEAMHQGADEIDRLTAEVARLKGLLKRCEWARESPDEREDGCPVCEEYKEDGHTPTCDLAAAIRDR